jgi:hypothetical protein
MRKCLGITEPYWTALPEDKRLFWKYFCRALALIAAFFIVKTGNAYFDWLLGAFTAIFLAVVIETQRSYSKLSPRFRKNNVRVAIFLGSWAVAVLGIAVFAQIGVTAIASVFVNAVANDLKHTSNFLTKFVLLGSFIVAAPVAVMRAFRQTGFEELIYDLPRNGLKRLLIYKVQKATSFPMFAHIELSILLISLVYASAVAQLAKAIIALV